MFFHTGPGPRSEHTGPESPVHSISVNRTIPCTGMLHKLCLSPLERWSSSYRIYGSNCAPAKNCAVLYVVSIGPTCLNESKRGSERITLGKWGGEMNSCYMGWWGHVTSTWTNKNWIIQEFLWIHFYSFSWLQRSNSPDKWQLTSRQFIEGPKRKQKQKNAVIVIRWTPLSVDAKTSWNGMTIRKSLQTNLADSATYCIGLWTYAPGRGKKKTTGPHVKKSLSFLQNNCHPGVYDLGCK